MNCPSCGNAMKPYEKQSIEIDVCTGCRGIWLDRGELEKLLEVEARSSSLLYGERSHEGHGREEHGHEEHRYEERRQHGEHQGSHGYEHGYERGGHSKDDKQYGHRGRRKSLLSELFGGFGGDD